MFIAILLDSLRDVNGFPTSVARIRTGRWITLRRRIGTSPQHKEYESDNFLVAFPRRRSIVDSGHSVQPQGCCAQRP